MRAWRAPCSLTAMSDLLLFLVFLGVYVALQAWLLPRLGIGT